MTVITILLILYITFNIILCIKQKWEPLQFSMIFFYIPFMFRGSKYDTYQEYIKHKKSIFLKYFNEEEWYIKNHIQKFLWNKYADKLVQSSVYDIRIRKSDSIYVYIYVMNHSVLPLLSMEMDLFSEMKQKCEIILIYKNYDSTN